MPRLLILGLTLVGFLIALEFGVPAWRQAAPVSTAPIFTLPMASEAMMAPGKFTKVVNIYQADRGGELKLAGPDGSSLSLFYFEWDQLDHGRSLDIARHEPEICNIAAGFTLLSRNANRSFEAPGHPPLVFDATTFADPSKRQVHVYKAAWLQGFGTQDIRNHGSRLTVIKNAFHYGRGAARVIECGVSGAQDEAHAWQIFQEQVLQHLAWSTPKT